MYLNVMSGLGGSSTPLEAVIVGDQVCYKIMKTKQCSASPSMAQQLEKLGSSGTSTFLQNSSRITWASIPSKVVAGRVCDGFHFKGFGTAASVSGPVNGDLYIQADGTPCSEVGVASTTDTQGKTTKASVSVTWSRFNDPSLKIPTL